MKHFQLGFTVIYFTTPRHFWGIIVNAIDKFSWNKFLSFTFSVLFTLYWLLLSNEGKIRFNSFHNQSDVFNTFSVSSENNIL